MLNALCSLLFIGSVHLWYSLILADSFLFPKGLINSRCRNCNFALSLETPAKMDAKTTAIKVTRYHQPKVPTYIFFV